MSKSAGDVFIRVGARGVQTTQRAFAGLQGSMMRYFGIAGIAGAVAMSTKQVMSFSKEMAQVNTLLRLGAGEYKAMRKEILDVSYELGAAPTSMAKAFYQITSAGFRGAEAVDLLKQSFKGAVAGATDVFTWADVLTTALLAYGKSAESATDFSDALFEAIEFGKTTAPELGATLHYVAKVAAQMSIPFEDLAAMIAALAREGIPTQKAMIGLRQMLVGLLSPTNQMQEAARKFGITLKMNEIAEMGMVNWMKRLTEVTGGAEEKLAMFFGGAREITAALTLMGKNTKTFTDALEDMEKRFGKTETAFNIMEKDISRGWERFVNQIKGIPSFYFEEAIAPAASWVQKQVSNIIAPPTPKEEEAAIEAPFRSAERLAVAVKELRMAEEELYRFANRPGAKLREAMPGIRTVESIGLEMRTANVDRLQRLVDALKEQLTYQQAQRDLAYVTGGVRITSQPTLVYSPEFQRYYDGIAVILTDLDQKMSRLIELQSEVAGQ